MKNTAKVVSGKKLLIFKLLTILLPFGLLFILELSLRLTNYGHDTSLFIKFPGHEDYYVLNKYASDKFFPDSLNATRGNHEPFLVSKTTNTFRIFILGESTTIGFPYFHNGSFHRWLLYRLMRMYPGRNFEIINLSLTAVNSYTVMDFGMQLASYQPDAILIYTGHNEYYGALGVGSTSNFGSNRYLIKFLLWLRGLRTVQLFHNEMMKLTALFSIGKIDDRETLMKRMAENQKIQYGSSDYKKGIDQFDRNMSDLCRALNKEKIPTFLSTIVSNEKDLVPFVSGTIKPSATTYFSAGREAYKHADFQLAKKDFVMAKEFDELRFRGPDAINIIIKKLANNFNNVHMVDTKSLFEQFSPHGIIGNETLLEHVHPNLLGYAIMSEAFFQAIKKQKLISEDSDIEISFSDLLKDMPILKMDSLNGVYKILLLKSGWPFNEPLSQELRYTGDKEKLIAEKLAFNKITWDEAMNRMIDFYRNNGDKENELKVMESFALEYPQIPQFLEYAANLNQQLNRYDDAAFYYRKLYDLNNEQQIPGTIFHLDLQADKPEKALNYVKYVNGPQQLAVKLLLEQIIRDKLQFGKKANISVKRRISTAYKELGIIEMAAKYAN